MQKHPQLRQTTFTVRTNVFMPQILNDIQKRSQYGKFNYDGAVKSPILNTMADFLQARKLY